ncbi:MAG TPA: VWA domain-containing protein [Vicinamibacterales bacterium]|nr:VWA domain-containing protein [Vicinamibacterales bacterium]
MTARAALTVLAVITAAGTLAAQHQPDPAQPAPAGSGYQFSSGVDLVNVTATVSDASGRFVPNLRKDDFIVYEDDQPQEVTYFTAERVSVSLGLVLDTSGSMAGEKWDDARTALDRFMYDLLDERDELALFRFSDHPSFVEGWATDRTLLSRAIARIAPNGGTALYDAVLDAVPFAATGHNQKKALVVISDGNDTSSIATLQDVRSRLHDSEVLVYAVGIDGDADDRLRQPQVQPRFPPPGRPSPFPPGRRPRGRFPVFPQIFGPGGGRSFPRASGAGDDRVNAATLRDLTDDSGGRTEIVHSGRDLDPATASIADELSKQYALGYSSPVRKDGRWHSIRVEVRNRAYRVRARRGYVAS